MKKYMLAGSCFALIAVVLGAFASHALKNYFEASVLQSFQTGIRYMMYHGLALLIFSQWTVVKNPWIFRMFFWGVIVFSGSIFLLCLSKSFPLNLSWLGPFTPLGGSMLIFGWGLLSWEIYKSKKS